MQLIFSVFSLFTSITVSWNKDFNLSSFCGRLGTFKVARIFRLFFTCRWRSFVVRIWRPTGGMAQAPHEWQPNDGWRPMYLPDASGRYTPSVWRVSVRGRWRAGATQMPRKVCVKRYGRINTASMALTTTNRSAGTCFAADRTAPPPTTTETFRLNDLMCWREILTAALSPHWSRFT